MKRLIYPAILLALLSCIMLTGCSVNSIILGCGGGCGEPERHDHEIKKPLTGTTNIYPSEYKLRITDMNSTSGTVLDKSGREVGRVSCPEPIYNVSCRYGAFLLTTRTSPDDKAVERIYRHKLGDKKCTLVADRILDSNDSMVGHIQGIPDKEIPGQPKLTPNDKIPKTPEYLIFYEKPASPPKNYPDYSEERKERPLKIILLDPQKALESVFSTGTYCIDYRIYPYGSKILYLELSKDELGDDSNYSLKVTDISKKKTYNIATNRRKPKYMWCGNNAIAVSAYDKYKIPTLSLFSLDTGKLTRLSADRNASVIIPERYDSSNGEIIFKTYPTNTQGYGSEEWWRVHPGKKASRLPKSANPVMPGMMAGPGIPGGMPMPGMLGGMPPGMPQMPPSYPGK
ncbi:MAG: hypothetical protein ACYC27_09765 [Armatimonadota bacterium]